MVYAAYPTSVFILRFLSYELHDLGGVSCM